MRLLPQSKPVAAEEPTTDPLKEQAADLASHAPTFDRKERSALERHLVQAARDRQADTIEMTADVVEATAKTIGRSRTETAREAATIVVNAEAHKKFLRDHNLSQTEPANLMFLAEQQLGIEERRLERIQDRLDGKLPHGKPNRDKRAELDEETALIERRIADLWSFLRPIQLGSPFGRDPEPAPKLMNDERCKCGVFIGKRERFQTGKCKSCKLEALLNGAERTQT